MKCTIHPERDAVARCVKCEKPYCRQDLERIGRNYVCFNCLKGIAKSTLSKRSYRPLTMGLISAAGLFVVLGIVAIGSKYSFLIGAFMSFLAFNFAQFMKANGDKAVSVGMNIGKAVVYFIEAYLVSMNKTMGLVIGVIICVILLAYGIGNFAQLSQIGIVIDVVIPVLILFLLVINRKELTGGS